MEVVTDQGSYFKEESMYRELLGGPFDPKDPDGRINNVLIGLNPDGTDPNMPSWRTMVIIYLVSIPSIFVIAIALGLFLNS